MRKAFFIFLIILAGSSFANAQPTVISIDTAGKSLAGVLEELNSRYALKFAFNTPLFESIQADFTFEKLTLDAFLHILENKYAIRSKEIEGTWVLVKNTRETPTMAKREVPYIQLSGYIRDKQTGEHLIYCHVATSGNRGGMTNELGYFHFEVPESDSVRLMISHLGYQRLDTFVTHSERIRIDLSPADIILDPVRVVSYENRVLEPSPHVDRISFNPLSAANIPRISNDDLGNALLLIPGVNFQQGGISGISIRGSSPTDNLVLLDGIPVLETNHLLGNMSVLNAKFVHQAFVSRGGFDAAYGGRTAGMIQITGKSGKNRNPYVDVSANLLNTNLLTNIPLSPTLSVTAAWRRSFIDQWQNYLYYRLIDDVVVNEDNPVTSSIIPTITYNDVNAKLSFHPSDELDISLNMLLGNDTQIRDFELLRTEEYYRNESTQSRNLGFSLIGKWQAGERWYHAFSAGMSTLESDRIDETGELKEITEVIENPGQGQGKGKGLAKTRERTYSREIFDIDNGFNAIEEYRIDWKTDLQTGIFRHDAGIGLTVNHTNYDFFAHRSEAEIQIDSIADQSSLHMLHTFFQQRIDVTDHFHARWGVRAESNLLNGKTYWQPRLGVEYHRDEQLKIYLLTGIYYQYLSGIKRFDSQGYFNQVWYIPTANGFGTVQGDHYIAGIKYEDKGWFIDLEGYLKNSRGRIHLFAEEAGSGNHQSIAYAPYETEERHQGFDLFIQKKQRYFNHMVSYSLSSSELRTPKLMDNQWFSDYNERPHRVKLTEMVYWKQWTLTGSLQLASGLPLYRYSTGNEPESLQRTPSFTQVDLALTREIVMSRFRFEAGLSMLNLLNRSNVVEVNYLRFASELGSMTVRSDISALGFTPLFFVNARFQ